MASLCLSHQKASTDMQHDLFWSLRNLDLRSYFDLYLSRSDHISFEASLREKHDDVIADSLSLLVQSYLWKNISPVTSILTICDLWSLNLWPEVTFNNDLIKRRVQKLSIRIICVFLAITVPDATPRFLKNIITSIELCPLVTSGDPNIALRRKMAEIL